jgi:hypothetical protein
MKNMEGRQVEIGKDMEFQLAFFPYFPYHFTIFFRIFHIFSHNSTLFSSIFSISFQFSTYFSSIFFIEIGKDKENMEENQVE